MKYEDLKEDDAVVICMPTSGPHVEDVSIRQCDFCGTDVWFAKSTEAIVPEKHYLMCLECVTANKVTEKIAVAMPSDDQIRDIAKTTGATFEEVKASVTKMVQIQSQNANYENN